MTRRPKNNNNTNNDANEVTLENRFTLKKIHPLTPNQKLTFEEFSHGQNLLLTGVPGSGKTFLAMYLACRDVMISKNHEKVIILRSAQASKAQGFLPGTLEKKMEVYEAPYSGICTELFGRKDAYSVLKNKKVIEFASTSFLRGNTFTDAVVILDEYQNLQGNELYLVLSRMGQNTRLIMTGDGQQTDLKWDDERDGFYHFEKILKKLPSISTVEFDVEDICRSGFVKEFIIETLKYMEQHKVKLF